MRGSSYARPVCNVGKQITKDVPITKRHVTYVLFGILARQINLRYAIVFLVPVVHDETVINEQKELEVMTLLQCKLLMQ